MRALLDGLAGALAGVLTGFGVGGGGLLMIYMTSLGGLEQYVAQGVNLWYYLPAAGGSLIFHIRARTIDAKTVWPAVAGGLASAALGAFLAGLVDTNLLRKLFSLLLLYVGLRELIAKK
ncbi:MAG: TSUP family transporter [Oscillospiraceae bacterium]|jgi:uncharacterized membrane protein YfcA|nr:TSUP family transporter [Oscillospiraceae bacterium]